MVRFRTKAMAGGLTATLLLGAAMALCIARLNSTATSQLEQVRAEELQITLAERLRWNVELIISIGKGYFITEDPALLAKLSGARAEMRANVQSLSAWARTHGETASISRLDTLSERFDRAHEELITARTHVGASELLRRFDRDVLPIKRELAASLDDLVQRKEAAMDVLYHHAAQERRELTSWMYGLVAMLILVGSVITTYFALQLARAYRAERLALRAARNAANAREELLGVVAHELRNPLNAIAIKAALVQRIATLPMAKQQAESITSIASRMDHLIKEMLDVATIEAGRLSVRVAPCPVASIIDTIMDVFLPLSTAKQITLHCTFDRKDTPHVHADRDRVLQVLSNLLANALNFSPADSTIVLEAVQQGEWMRFSISDQGPGIPTEQQARLFDRFWRASASQVKGTGLGLFIAKGIVEAHHGSIWVESAGGGATFRFTLPIVEPASSETCTDSKVVSPVRALA